MIDNQREVSLIMAEHELYRRGGSITAGIDALHATDPCEILCRMEEESAEELTRRDAEAIRSETFGWVRQYLFGGGADPRQVQARLESLVRSFAPDLLNRTIGEREWIDETSIQTILAKNCINRDRCTPTREVGIAAWWQSLPEEEAKIAQLAVHTVLADLITQSAPGDKKASWRSIVAYCFSMAKALSPNLIGSMSLEDMAVLCGDSGRATTCHRTRRYYNRRVEESGALGTSVHYQKKDSTVKKYKLAQQGNNNRSKSRRRKRRWTTQKK